MATKLNMRQSEAVFLDTWFNMAPVTYNELWRPGVLGTELIDECAQMYPKLYRKILDQMEEMGYDF